ncbi:hypothetical protein EPN15_05560 [Patescibacteria group bacterium]|nr:MAG: hypothetical protein EPN15_05560 [Patescibacteria group bacterium]
MAKIQSNAIFLSFFVLLFLFYSFLAFKSPGKFTSPDETANFYFIRQFAGNLFFKVAEPLNGAAPIVVPRSIMVQKDALLPGSFFGMPLLYGAIGWFLGKWIILFLTPLFSAIAVFVFYKLIILIFDRRTAIISAGLMAIHPAFWYYTARGMFHNDLFLDLLIFGFYFLTRTLITHNTNNVKYQGSSIKNYANYALAGLFIGGAIAVRTSEIIWVGIILLALIIFHRQKIDWRIGIWIALIGMIISMIPILYQNNKLYGNALTFSYTVGAERAEVAGQAAAKAAGSANVFAKIFNDISGLFEKAIFPFGIHWDNIFANVWNYGVVLVWPFALLTLFGCVLFFRNGIINFIYSSVRRSSDKRVILIYFIGYLFLSIYLLIYYGSWKINDNILGSNLVSLEQAYARYWLPIYIFGLPFASLAILTLLQKGLSIISYRYADQRRWICRSTQSVLMCLFVIILFIFSVSSAVLERNVGLAKVRQNTLEYKEVALKAKRTIESNAVIVSGKADKIFFPEFKVIASEINTNKKAKQLKKILQKAPVYISILDFSGQSEKLNKLESFGFKIGKEMKVSTDVALYRISY